MTSEVVVMNRTGIALASDSAATVRARGKAKLFHADKLFMLSHTQPVGVMIYSNSALLGVPWEVILKLFRTELGNAKLKTVEEYAKRLIKFLSGNDHLFPLAAQQRHYEQLVDGFYARLAKISESRFVAFARADFTGKNKPDLRKVQAEVVSEELQEWRAKNDAMCFKTAIGTDLATAASDKVNKLVLKHFPDIGGEVVNDLTELARLIVNKEDIPHESRSGLVIVGYGEDEFFPVMQEYQVGEIYKSQLKFRHMDTWAINNETPSVVKAFAQSDMAETFLHGISPTVERNQIEEIAKIVMEMPDVVIDAFPGVGRNRKADYKRDVRAISIDVARAVVKKLRDYRHKLHHIPILQFISHLPKNELAHVASSLVNLNSFQKRMTFGEDETVGGPIDVAVISKGDGFVWIARKHYFKAELNAHFFRNRSSLVPDHILTEKQMEDDSDETQS